MEGLIALTMGSGLLISLLFSGVVGVMAGGMVVPGYLALEIEQPIRIAVTLAIAGATYGTMRLMGNFVFLYGRRRFLLTVLMGFLLAMLCRHTLGFWTGEVALGLIALGLVVPGLIANWMQSQGVLRTLAVIAVVTICVHFLVTSCSVFLPTWFISW